MAIVSSRLPARAAPRRGFRPAIKDFYWKAYEDNLTGLSAMVAYNLLLSVFPLALGLLGLLLLIGATVATWVAEGRRSG